jgi:hypothetical protein
MDDIKFAEGLYFKEPSDNAPDFIKGRLSIQKNKFLEWVGNAEFNESGYINLDIKISKGGKPYIAVNDWKPNQQQQQPQYTTQQQKEMDTPLPAPQNQEPLDPESVPF